MVDNSKQQRLTAGPARPLWPILRGLAEWRLPDLGPDLAAGLTLAAIAIPEQMATARLGGFSPALGLIVFVCATIGFALLGSSRVLSAGADSTITPIFAGGLIAASGTGHDASLVSVLALMTGAWVLLGGIFRMGWVSALLSIPVTTGFLAGIAVHIAASQLPSLLGISVASSDPLHRFAEIGTHLGQTNLVALAVGAGIFAVTYVAEKIDARIPGTLIALLAIVFLVYKLKLAVPTVGAVTVVLPRSMVPNVDPAALVGILPLSLIIAAVTMIQTAATTQAFPTRERAPDVDRDFIGVGAGSILAGLLGGFPANASPPRTGAVSEAGGRSQLAALVAAAAVVALLLFGTGLLAYVPLAALAGILLFVAQRIVRVSVFANVFRTSLAEFLLILATMAAIIVLPIQTGVGLGILFSVAHGVWTITRTGIIELERVPGTTVWWPASSASPGEKVDGVIVLAYQAPLAFLNATMFERDVVAMLNGRAGVKLVVIEASSMVEIDYTAAQSLTKLIRDYRAKGIEVAVSRLESVRAEKAFARFGIADLLGPDRLFRSVQDAVTALAPQTKP